MPENKKGITDAVEILQRRFYERHPARQQALDQVRENDAIARKIQTLRKQAGLTQTQLAKVVGTTAGRRSL